MENNIVRLNGFAVMNSYRLKIVFSQNEKQLLQRMDGAWEPGCGLKHKANVDI